VEDGKPTFGVVYAPVLQTTYGGGEAYGAWRVTEDGGQEPLKVTDYSNGAATVVASRSHRGEAVEAFLRALTDQSEAPEVRSMGSSLKICLVASGEADVYPRLGPTSEWDTAAAHAVVLGAGGHVTNACGQPLQYNKESILNPWFLVFGSGSCDWTKLVPPENG
ncbi:MAG: 3'(2'),5'-bisphosphate nucleotidase CysQ family protein, partial [Rubripirellula sp.]